jgi:hypothetical protein
MKFSSHNLAEAGRKHARAFCGITWVCVQLFIPHMQHLFECLGIGSLHYWLCSNWITTMQRQLWDSQIKQGKNVTGNFLWKVTEGLLASPVRKFGLKVRLTGQLKEFQRHMLDWRGISVLTSRVQKEASVRPEKLWRNAPQCTPENATLDCV